MSIPIVSGLYQGIVNFKNLLYDREYLHSVELPIPVLSIGNLTMGGTGKTPLTDFCLKYYQRRRVKTAVVSRNYKARVRGIAQVDVNREDAAAYYGDEPVLLARRNPQSLFYVGPKKYLTAQYAFAKDAPELLLLDDGFQHRQLYRDVDLVILDATESPENYRCVPDGRAREPFAALSRATAILVSKANLVSEEDLSHLVGRIKKQFEKPVFCFNYEIHRLCPHGLGSERPLRECAGVAALLISGLAKPQSFEDSLRAYGLKILKHQVFADHYAYQKTDVEALIQEWRKQGEPALITTEKDYVKLAPLWPGDVPLWTAPLEVQMKTQEDLFYEILDQVLH
jgi:tetraacyldisaccharide 4'-kinase